MHQFIKTAAICLAVLATTASAANFSLTLGETPLAVDGVVATNGANMPVTAAELKAALTAQGVDMSKVKAALESIAATKAAQELATREDRAKARANKVKAAKAELAKVEVDLAVLNTRKAALENEVR